MDLALNVTLVGLFVVFSSLIILSVLISLSSKIFSLKIFGKNANAASGLNTVNTDKSVNKNNNAVNTKTNNPQHESELIAVLTAAIMASMQQTSDFNVRIKSFRRIHTNSSAWSAAGIDEQINNRF